MSAAQESQLSASLRSRTAEIDVAIANLDREFATLAHAFDVGDQAALRKASAIEQQIAQLRREKLIIAGREQRIAQEQQDQAAQAEQEQRNEQLVQAKQLADAITALHVDLDRLMNTLREKLTQRASALAELQRLDLDASALVNRLSQKAVITRACCAAGLHKFAELQTVAPNSMVPLATANAILLGIGRSPAPPAAVNGNANDSFSAGPPAEKLSQAPEGVPRRRLMKGNGGS